ncbi:MAG TPA: hypothetical protein VLF66_06055 [Thermoanaerobaculia bacterium]|nr:hypothetical protein [Thermoanaerobaculia bacterium]
MRAPRALIPLAAVAVVALAGPAALQAQILDLTGTWNLELEAVPNGLTPEAAARQGGPVLQPEGVVIQPCLYSGTVVASQAGSQWTGPAELGLVSGPADCPAEMNGDLTGELSEDGGVIFITGFIDGGNPSGQATFDGTISPNPGGSGTMIVSQGDFQDTEGDWVAVLQQSVLEIPELTPAGLAVLTLLLLAAGAWLLGRQSAA